MVFKPSWFAIFLTLITLFFLLSLGRWQLKRADEKRGMLQQFEQMELAKPTMMPTLKSAANIVQYQRIRGEGRFINHRNFLLDNQFHQHRLGFNVITPLQLDNGNWVLVDRGWVPMGKSRQQLPGIDAIENAVTIEGRAYYPSNKTWVLSDVLDNRGQWPLIIEKVSIDKLAALLHHKLYPFIIRLNSDVEYGFIRDWKIVSMSPQRHIGYAVQWFTMAFVVLIIFIGWNLKKVERND